MILCEEQNKKSNVGTISYIPAAFGIACASVVIRGLIGEPTDPPEPPGLPQKQIVQTIENTHETQHRLSGCILARRPTSRPSVPWATTRPTKRPVPRRSSTAAAKPTSSSPTRCPSMPRRSAPLPRLRLICIAATGMNHIDLAAAAECGVTREECRRILDPRRDRNHHRRRHRPAAPGRLLRPLHEGALRRRRASVPLRPHDASGSTVRTGESSASATSAATSPASPKPSAARWPHLPPRASCARSPTSFARPLDELLTWADVVSVHCPLTDRTAGLIGARELGLMKPSAILPSTSRGGIVDEAALATHSMPDGWPGGA